MTRDEFLEHQLFPVKELQYYKFSNMNENAIRTSHLFFPFKYGFLLLVVLWYAYVSYEFSIRSKPSIVEYCVGSLPCHGNRVRSSRCRPFKSTHCIGSLPCHGNSRSQLGTETFQKCTL